jgi:hypothetical protein
MLFICWEINPITLGSLIAEIEGDCSPDEIAAIKHTDEALLARLIDEINASKSDPFLVLIPTLNFLKD